MNPKAGLWKLALTGVLIVLLVVAELAAIIWVAGELGWWTLAILISTTVLGVVLLQREWRKAWGALAETLKSGQLPGGRLADATLILLGGVLLVMPGLISDTIGLLLLLPFTRPFIRSAITWWASRKIGTTPSRDWWTASWRARCFRRSLTPTHSSLRSTHTRKRSAGRSLMRTLAPRIAIDWVIRVAGQ